MKKKNMWIIYVMAFALLFIVATALYEQLRDQFSLNSVISEEAETEAEKSEAFAPDFTVYDKEENAVDLSDFRGKPVVLNFWASWCGPCKSEMPDFQSAYEKYKDEIHFVMVNLTDGSQETVETAEAFIEDEGYTFPIYFDTDLDAAMVYGVNSVPRTYFIDAEGNLVAQAMGVLAEENLLEGIGLITDSLDNY